MLTCVLYIPQDSTVTAQWLSDHAWLLQHSLVLLFDGSTPLCGLPKEISVVHHQNRKGIVSCVRRIFKRLHTPHLLLLRAETNLTKNQLEKLRHTKLRFGIWIFQSPVRHLPIVVTQRYCSSLVKDSSYASMGIRGKTNGTHTATRTIVERN